mgnify:CR=1 FL=1
MCFGYLQYLCASGICKVLQPKRPIWRRCHLHWVMCDKHYIYNLTKTQTTKQNKQLQTLYITTDMFISYVFMVFSGHIMVSYKSKMCCFLRHHEIVACRPVWSTEKCKAVWHRLLYRSIKGKQKSKGGQTRTLISHWKRRYRCRLLRSCWQPLKK